MFNIHMVKHTSSLSALSSELSSSVLAVFLCVFVKERTFARFAFACPGKDTLFL